MRAFTTIAPAARPSTVVSYVHSSHLTGYRVIDRRSLLIGSLLGLTAPSAAQPQAGPNSSSAARPLATLAVFGDSLGDGIWGALFRRFFRTTNIRVLRASLASTGFNRTPYEDTFAQSVANGPVNVAIMFTGANDAQDAWPLENGAPPGPFGTESWRTLYGQRLRRFHGVVARSGIPLLWVILPTMRDRGFEARIAKVRAEHQGLCEEFAVPTIGADMAPSPTGTPAIQPLHYEDGIHLTETTNNRLAELIICHLLMGRYAFVTGVVEDELRGSTGNSCV